MRYESYAQELEDIVLYSVLRNVKNIFYIDIGANDPINFNVTYFFYLRGGKGINIEPLRSMCLLLDEQRERDINLCVGVGKKSGYMELTACGMMSSFNKDIVQKSDYFSECKKHKKRIMTLTEIQRKYIKREQQIHFCKIDVEGYEREVLEGIVDWESFRPWIYVMEAVEPGTDILCHDKWEEILLQHGYIFAYQKGINRYYVDEQKEHLLENFKKVEDFIKENSIVKMKMEYI